MSRVAAFVDAVGPITEISVTADALARLLSLDVDVIHVAGQGPSTVGVGRILHGDPCEVIRAELAKDDVVIGVLGVRSSGGAPLLGHVARDVITHADIPIVLVPPGVDVPSDRPSVLVPVDGARATSEALEPILRSLAALPVSVTTAHVFDTSSAPPLLSSDEDRRVVSDEFDLLHCYGTSDQVLLDIGIAAARLSELVERCQPDLVVIAWAQRLDGDSAVIVKRLLERRTRLLFAPIAPRRADGALGAPDDTNG